MKRSSQVGLLFLLICFIAVPLSFGDSVESTDGSPVINWIQGPGPIMMGDLASIKIEEPYIFADKKDTVKLMEYFGNPSTDSELGSVFPKTDDESWFVIFEYSDTGHIKDTDKDKIDADALLKSIKEGTEASNKEREKLGASPLYITGWMEAPNYNEELHSLVWCTRGESDSGSVLNYEARLLCREGYVSATLVCAEEELAIAKPHMTAIINDFMFVDGKRYQDYVEGKDKLSEMSLAALVAGGAVVATNKGILVGLLLLLKKFGIVIVAALVGAFKKFFWKNKDVDHVSETTDEVPHNMEDECESVMNPTESDLTNYYDDDEISRSSYAQDKKSDSD